MTVPMKVLIAYDGSPCGDDALVDLQRAGLTDDVEAIVLSVADYWLLPEGDTDAPPQPVTTVPQDTNATAAAMLERAKINAASAAERLQRQFPRWKISAESAADSPSWGIVQKAETWGADLIVVGSHGYSSLGRWVLGSVSQTVLTQAPCSVRIARGRHTPVGRPLRILVGVDGSVESEFAVRAVAQRNWPAGTDIHLVMVVNPAILDIINSSTLAGEDDRPKGHVDFRITKMLEHFVDLARQNPAAATVSTSLLPGDPKKVLPKEAELWGADCIFIGSRGLSNWERLLLGSVSTAVAVRTQCPVEVVRQRA